MGTLKGVIADAGNEIDPIIDATFTNVAIGKNVAILKDGFELTYKGNKITISPGMASCYGYKGIQSSNFTADLIGVASGYFYVYLEWDTINHTFAIGVVSDGNYVVSQDNLSISNGVYRERIYKIQVKTQSAIIDPDGTVSNITAISNVIDLADEIRLYNPYIAEYVKKVDENTYCETQESGDNSNAPASTAYVYNSLNKMKLKEDLYIKLNVKVYVKSSETWNDFSLHYRVSQRADMFVIDEGWVYQSIDMPVRDTDNIIINNIYKFDSLEEGTIIGTVPFEIGSGTPNRLFMIGFTLSAGTVISVFACKVDSNKNIKIEKRLGIDGTDPIYVDKFAYILLTGSFFVKN